MNEDVYYDLYQRLNKKGDVFELADKHNISEGVLFAILSQKIVRKTKRDYHGLKRQSPALLRQWKKGKSLLKISQERKFSPVLTSSFILREYGITKKEIHMFMRYPHDIEDSRIRKEILEVIEEEVVYSPDAIEIQRSNGKVAEQKIGKWLDRQNAAYITEHEVRELYKKTPDFLLKDFFTVERTPIHWVESKASFGDKVQMKGDYHRQLKYYVELFGKGLVVYWHGYINDSDTVQPFGYDVNILICNSCFIEGDHV